MCKVVLFVFLLIMPAIMSHAEQKGQESTDADQKKATAAVQNFQKVLVRASILKKDQRYQLLLLDWEKTD